MLTAIIIAHNEEQNISRALTSLKFCDQIIVIDNNSTDDTVRIAQKSGADVIHSSIQNDFARLRNDAMAHTAHDWILFLDADEVISDNLRIHLKHELENPQFSSYYLRRRDHFWGKILEHGEVATVYEQGIIRLMKKGSGLWEGRIHEVWRQNSDVGELDGFIEHFPHPDISSFLDSVNSYSSIRAKELHNIGMPTLVFQLIFYPIGKFLNTYVLQRGYLDGAPGFVYSCMMSFHSFLVRAKAITNHEIK